MVIEQLLAAEVELADKAVESCDGDDCCSGSDCDSDSDSEEDCDGECSEPIYSAVDIVDTVEDIISDATKVTTIDIPEPLEAHSLAMTLDFDAGKIIFINVPTEYTDDDGETQTYDNEQMDTEDLWRKASVAAGKSTNALYEAADADEDEELNE